MSKYIKRFKTHQEHIDYLSDSSLEYPFVGVCDECADNPNVPGVFTIFVKNNNIIFSSDGKTSGILYEIDNSNNIINTYNIGYDSTPRASGTTTYMNINNNTYIPYNPNSYYSWSVTNFWGYENPNPNNGIQILINDSDIADIKFYYGEYTFEKCHTSGETTENTNIEKYISTPPYNISGYPGNYTGPTLNDTWYSWNSPTGDNPYTTNNGIVLNIGDTIYSPITRGIKFLPGARIYMYSRLEIQ